MTDADIQILANNLDGNPEMISKKVSFVLRKIEMPSTKRAGKKSTMIEGLKKSNETLVRNLHNLNSTTNCLKDFEQLKNVTLLANDLTGLEHQVETEKSYLKDLLQQINKFEILKQNIPKVHKGTCQTIHTTNDDKELNKYRERLQEKLRVETVHLGKEITTNKELREKIRCMMSERTKFNKEYDGLLQKLRSGKQIMQDIAQSVRVAEGQRKNIQLKIEKINSQEKKQVALQEEEAYSLAMRKVTEQRLWKFHMTVQKERQFISPIEKQRKKSKRYSDEFILNDYRTFMLEILEHCGEPSEKDLSYDSIVRKLKRNEFDILSLFKYATHLNHEVEVLKDKIVEQGKQVSEMISDQDMKSFGHENNYKTLLALKERKEEEDLLTKDGIKANKKLLARLFEGVKNLIRISDTDISPFLLLLGENDKVNVFNYKVHMDALETKLVEIINSIPFSSHISPSLVTNVSKAKNDSNSTRQKNVPLALKTVITATCQECTAYKNGIKELARQTGVLS